MVPVVAVRLVHASAADAPVVAGPEDLLAVVRPLLELQAQEVMVAVALDARHRPIAVAEIGRGTVCTVPCDPRVVFQVALLANAAAVAIAHNHPSGVCTPSPDDRALTLRLVRAGEIMGIPVLDHLIVGAGGRHASLRALYPDLFIG